MKVIENHYTIWQDNWQGSEFLTRATDKVSILNPVV